VRGRPGQGITKGRETSRFRAHCSVCLRCRRSQAHRSDRSSWLTTTTPGRKSFHSPRPFRPKSTPGGRRRACVCQRGVRSYCRRQFRSTQLSGEAAFRHRNARQSVEDAWTAIGSALEGDPNTATKVFGRESTCAGASLLMISHLHNHLGEAIACARSIAVSPPWSRGRGE
jgi:hypothetical protein